MITGDDLLRGLQAAQEVLQTNGSVLPVTLSHCTLCAELENGNHICGETELDRCGEGVLCPLPAINRVYLQPQTPACEQAIQAIAQADLIVIGPGDLYTSILPNLLVQDVPEAIRNSTAKTVYICNLMTKHGETDGFRASNFVREVQRYLGTRLDHVLLHDGSFPAHLLEHYVNDCQHPVLPDVDAMRHVAHHVCVNDLLAVHGDRLVRHAMDRLVRAILSVRAHRHTSATISSPATARRT